MTPIFFQSFIVVVPARCKPTSPANQLNDDSFARSAFVADTLLRYYSIRIRAMIVIEPMFFDRGVQSDFLALRDRTNRYNKKRTVRWNNVEEAMTYRT